MDRRFEAYEVALELAAALAPVLASLTRHDSSLACQMRRAAASVALCLAEGSAFSPCSGGSHIPRRRRVGTPSKTSIICEDVED